MTAVDAVEEVAGLGMETDDKKNQRLMNEDVVGGAGQGWCHVPPVAMDSTLPSMLTIPLHVQSNTCTFTLPVPWISRY